jgi:hypothetical protein
VEIATVSELDVVVHVPERGRRTRCTCSPAEIALTALPGRVFAARVRSADPVIVHDSRSKRVLFRLSGNLSRVEPGMFAQVSVRRFPDPLPPW